MNVHLLENLAPRIWICLKENMLLMWPNSCLGRPKAIYLRHVCAWCSCSRLMLLDKYQRTSQHSSGIWLFIVCSHICNCILLRWIILPSCLSFCMQHVQSQNFHSSERSSISAWLTRGQVHHLKISEHRDSRFSHALVQCIAIMLHESSCWRIISRRHSLPIYWHARLVVHGTMKSCDEYDSKENIRDEAESLI